MKSNLGNEFKYKQGCVINYECQSTGAKLLQEKDWVDRIITSLKTNHPLFVSIVRRNPFWQALTNPLPDSPGQEKIHSGKCTVLQITAHWASTSAKSPQKGIQRHVKSEQVGIHVDK